MKVLHINTVSGLGSTGRIMQDIHELCLNRGIDSCISFFSGRKEEEGRSYKIGNRIDHKIHALLSRVTGLQANFSIISTLRFIRFVSAFKPDLIHIHNIHSSFINIFLVLRWLSVQKIPVVITLHDCWFITGGCTHFTRFECDKWKNGCGKCPSYHSTSPLSLIDSTSLNWRKKRAALNRLEELAFVGVSQWVAQLTINPNLSFAKTFVIYNGVDLSVFKPTPSDIKCRIGLQGKFVVLGPADKWLLDCNRICLQRLVSLLASDQVLLLFGCRETQRRIISDKVVYYKYTTNVHELVELYSMADVFVNSTRQDTLSLINIESQACGTPVITFNNTGASETVDGNCGYLVENEDIDQMVFYINLVQQNGKRIYSHLCRKWVSDRFNKTINYSKYIDLYSSLVGNK